RFSRDWSSDVCSSDLINYGNDVRRAMLGLLERMPSMTVMMLVTSILIHRETGGNLTEVLERLSRLIRERFRFQRKVRTLSAEGRSEERRVGKESSARL